MTIGKRCWLLIAAYLFIFSYSPAQAGPALVFDADTGEVLIADDAGVSWHPASLTKMMTAYIVFGELRAGRLKLKQKITVSKRAAELPPSKIGIKAGRQITIDFALRALLVHSSNDMALTLAEAVSGSQSAFAVRMNATAKRLRMTGSHFVNPHGLNHIAQIVTARDLGLLVMHLKHDFPQYVHYFATPSLKVGKTVFKNRNGLLRTMPGVDGMKTGFICPSGYNLAASATINNRHLVAIVLGTTSVRIRNPLTRMLLEAGARLGRSNIKLVDIGNQPPGATVPADISKQACGKTSRVSWGKSANLKGWGVSFGTFDTSYKADAGMQFSRLLTGNALTSVAMGVYRLPGTKEYAPIAWGLDESSARSICKYLQAHSTSCTVRTPDNLKQLKQRFSKPKGKSKPKKNQLKKKPQKANPVNAG